MPKKIITAKTDLGFKLPVLNRTLSKKDYTIILVLGFLLLAVYKKNWFIVALVNNQPIATAELNQKLNKQYKDQVLGQLINEKLLQQEAAKKGIVITKSQIDEKIKSLENQYGGAEALNSILSQQGMTRDDLISQTKIQLIVEALYGSEATPSAEEIDKFMQDNKDAPEATDAAKFEALAKEQTKQTKLSKIFAEKFQVLKEAAKIQIF